MPIYDFRCLSCGNVFEDYLKSPNDVNPLCKCLGLTEKLISNFSCVVKGSEHRSLDCIVGADAEKRWEKINNKQGRYSLSNKGT